MKPVQPIKIACVSGVIGILVAIWLTLTPTNSSVSTTTLLTLWPTSIAGFGFNGPITFSFFSFLLITIEYGGNFVLYGLIGLVLSGAYKRLRNR